MSALGLCSSSEWRDHAFLPGLTTFGLRSRDPSRFLIDGLAFDDRLRNFRSEQPDGAQRVVIARDHVIDHIGIAIGIHYSNDRNAKAARFGDGDLLILGI